MTVATLTRKAILQGNAINTNFNFNFAVRSAADLQVYYTDANGLQTLLAANKYAVALNPIPAGQLWAQGGTVTYPLAGAAIAQGTSLTIARNVPLTQGSSLINQGGYSPQTVEQALDLLTMEDQQINEALSRAITAAISDVAPVMQLPAAAARANGLLGFDGAGNVTIYQQGVGAPISSPSVLVVDNIVALKALAVPSSAITVLVRGFAVIGDGGGGFYWWNANDVTADNGGTVIQLNAGGNGRFNKLL